MAKQKMEKTRFTLLDLGDFDAYKAEHVALTEQEKKKDGGQANCLAYPPATVSWCSIRFLVMCCMIRVSMTDMKLAGPKIFWRNTREEVSPVGGPAGRTGTLPI